MATLTASTRHWAGEGKWYFLSTIAAGNLVPTRAEITAGTDLTGEVSGSSGWSVESSQIDTPTYGTRFVAQIPGLIKAQASSLTFYASRNGVDVRAVLPRDTTGYILQCPGGDVTGYKATVFPVRVASVARTSGTDESAAMVTVSFSITDEPAEDITLPATA